MPKVTPLRVTQLEAQRAWDLYLRSHSGKSFAEKKHFREAAAALQAELAKFNKERVVQLDDRERRIIYVWLTEHTRTTDA